MRIVRHPQHVRGTRRGATVVELITLLAIIGIMVSVAAARVIPTQRDVLDRAGVTVVGAAVLDARAVASANHYRYDTDEGVVVDQLNALASTRATTGLNAVYVPGDATAMDVGQTNGQAPVSVTVVDPTTVAFALMTTQGTGETAHCWLAVDTLRDGTQYARMTDALFNDRNACSGAVAASCAATLAMSPALGTASDPHQLSARESCAVDATSGP